MAGRRRDVMGERRQPTNASAESIAGRWRITSMELWDQRTIDLIGPAFINFTGPGGGEFRFIAVDGWMHCRHGTRSGRPFVEFTWEGNDECDPASGSGWAKLGKSGALSGRIVIHQGDASGFEAVPFAEESRPATAASPTGRARR